MLENTVAVLPTEEVKRLANMLFTVHKQMVEAEKAEAKKKQKVEAGKKGTITKDHDTSMYDGFKGEGGVGCGAHAFQGKSATDTVDDEPQDDFEFM